MTLLIAGLIIFLGTHSLSIFAEGWRDAMVARIGEWPWKGLYSVLSLVGFVLIVRGYAEARLEPQVLYQPPGGLRMVAYVLLIPVFPLFLATYLPGRIKTLVKHPTLVAVKLWALAHLLVNGALADVLLFGGFLAWAVADRVSMKRRASRPLPGAPATPFNDAVAVAAGLALYAAFALWLHPLLIGVSVAG